MNESRIIRREQFIDSMEIVKLKLFDVFVKSIIPFF